MKLFCKALALVALSVMILAVVSGCGGKKPQAKAPSAAKAPKKAAKTASAPKPAAASPAPQSGEPASIPGVTDKQPSLLPGLFGESKQPPSAGPSVTPPPAAPKISPNKRPAPRDLLRAIRVRYATLKSVRLKGISSSKLVADGKTVNSSGDHKFQIAFKRPTSFDYITPESRVVSNGKTVYSYLVKPKRYVKTVASGK